MRSFKLLGRWSLKVVGFVAGRVCGTGTGNADTGTRRGRPLRRTRNVDTEQAEVHALSTCTVCHEWCK